MFKIWSIHYTHTKQKHTNNTWDFLLLLKHVKIEQHYVDLPLRQNHSSPPHFLLVPAWLLFSQVSPLPLSLNLLTYLCYLPGTYSHLHLPHVQQIASNINIVSPIVAIGYKLNKQGDSIQPWHIPFSIPWLIFCAGHSNVLSCIQYLRSIWTLANLKDVSRHRLF